jgi:PKD repeat protein
MCKLQCQESLTLVYQGGLTVKTAGLWKALGVLLALVITLTAVGDMVGAETSQVSVKYVFQRPVVERAGEYDRVTIPGLHSHGAPGAPILSSERAKAGAGWTNTLTGTQFRNIPLSVIEAVTVTHWVDPEGRQPITYEEWRSEIPARGPFMARRTLERWGELVPPQALPKVCVIVNSALYGSIQASVDQYASDLGAEGYAVIVYTASGGTPSDLRTFLQGELPGNLVGCLLVGDLPVPWYEMDDDFYGKHAEFPIDLYYMDLDGQWTDADADGKFDDHTDGAGDVGPEIWVGRLTASPLSGDEVTRIQNYFGKNHQYRTGDLNLAHRALAYIYDDWSYYEVSDLDLMYGDNVTVMNEKGMTSAEDYRERLEETHRFVHVMAHSSPWGHSFSSGWVSSTEIETIDPRVFFYNLFACSNARYVENNYMGGYYIFAPTYGLAAVGSTKTGSMLSFGQFYGPLGEGESLGEAYHRWFDYKAQGGFSLNEKQWHYGMTLLGDPTLKVVDLQAPTASILSPLAHEHLHATTIIVGTAAGTSFGNYALAYGLGTRPVTWTQLISSSNPVVNGTLATWDTRAFSGTYTLRLMVNANGQSNEDRITARVKNAEITSPVPNDILGPGSISITGTAAIAGFQNYVVEYGVGENPVSWSSTGIALAGGGLSEVINGTLATMDTTLMGGINDYTIRLTVNGSGSLVYQDQVMVHVDPTLQAGWPQSVAYRLVAPSMAIGDIDGDGDLEVVAAEGKYSAYDAKVYAWHHDGTLVNGWPQQTYGSNRSAPALADVDRDGDLEIIAGSDDWRVYAWHHDGSIVTGWPQMTGDSVYSSPAVGDIDGDGIIEIVVGSIDNKVHVWHYDGTIMNGWPQATEDSVCSSPALGDIDNDGDTEIVVGAYDGKVYAWHHDGAIASGWPVTTSAAFIISSPALGDIDDNGDIEVVIGGDQVYAWHHDGTAASGWPQPAGWPEMSSPALGDMDGDGDLEIVVGSNQVHAWHGDGTIVSGWPVALEFATDSSPVLGDLDGDADIEVVIGPGEYDGRVYAWHHDGAGVTDWPRVVPRFEGSGWHAFRLSSPILEDVDKDGDIEVTIGAEGKVMMWDLAGVYGEDNIEWKMFHHDLWHTGLYASSLPNLPPFVRDVEASPGYVAPGSGATITAKVSDEDGVASVTAEVEGPDETVRGTIALYDDGAHNDGVSGDGTYGNAWTTPSTKRDYIIDIVAADGLSKSCAHDNVASFTTRDVAYVQYHAYTINSDDINSDGTVNPGEYVRFSITLDNIGVLNAPGVMATISTVDPHLSYYDTGAASFGDITAGGTATCGSYDYYLRVGNTCPHSHTVRFSLDIDDSIGHAWTDSFDVTVIDNVGPAISYARATPGYVVAGEPIVITAHYVEDGSGISSVQAVIESPDETPVVTVTLHDDGVHNDGEAGDGTYGNTWTTDTTQREYHVDFMTEDGLANVRDYDNLALFTTRAFAKTADILFVPDRGGSSTDWFQSYYTSALDSLGYGYDVWDTRLREAPDSATLDLYTDGVVIWAAPISGYFDDWNVRFDIEAYLDAGGRLFISGQDVAWYLNGTTLLQDYLHATYVQDDADSYALNGTAGDPIGDGLALGISGGDGANNQNNPDEIDPISPAVTVLTYDTSATAALVEPVKPMRPGQQQQEGEREPSPAGVISSGTAGLRVDTGTFKVVYFSFGFEGINSASGRAMVMGRVLASLLPPVASFTSSSPDWLGQVTVFTNTITGQELITYTWGFGDGITSTLESPTHTYADPGFYTVVLTATNAAGSDVVSDTVTVYGPPTVAFSATPTGGFCPLTVAFTATATTTPPDDPTLTYLWRFGDGTTSTRSSPTHTYTTTGVYTVALAVSNVAGSDTLTRTHYITVEECSIYLPIVVRNS